AACQPHVTTRETVEKWFAEPEAEWVHRLARPASEEEQAAHLALMIAHTYAGIHDREEAAIRLVAALAIQDPTMREEPVRAAAERFFGKEADNRDAYLDKTGQLKDNDAILNRMAMNLTEVYGVSRPDKIKCDQDYARAVNMAQEFLNSVIETIRNMRDSHGRD